MAGGSNLSIVDHERAAEGEREVRVLVAAGGLAIPMTDPIHYFLRLAMSIQP